MFTAVAQKDLADAEGYFDEHLSQNDYYAAGEVHPGHWIGTATERLGLAGNVTRDHFHALCENRNPHDGKRLTRRENKPSQRRVFYDFTCSAPKSVSILAVTLDDRRLVEAHEAAARIAFRELEQFASTRVRKGGGQRDRTTGNLVAASFVHTSSRTLDPQLHTHFTVFNATFDDREKSWKALQAGAMYDATRYATAVYRNELARRLNQIGYRTVPAKYGFEIEGVGDAVLKNFSKRAEGARKIAAEMENKLGRKLSNNEMSHAVHQSRSRKLKGISTTEVRQRQLAQLSNEELLSLQTLTRSAQSSDEGPVHQNNEQAALAHSIEHVFERQSVVPEHEVLAIALAHRPGELDLPALKQQLECSRELVKTEQGLSTHKILKTELFLIQTVNAGCDSVSPLQPSHQPADWLDDDQQRAVLHVLRTGDRITGIRGLAGTGKTTVLRELTTACHAANVEPLFCAPTTAAADVLKREGFEAATLQSLLLSKPELSKRQLIVIDEAGAVGIDDMKRLFELANDCRILLVGDTGQHASVARGDALRILERHSHFQSGQLTRIRRQRRAEYRKAVELAAHRHTTEAFAQLERTGAVAVFTGDKLYDTAAQSFLKALEQNQSALLVAPTWSEIETVTEKVRAALKSSGHLAGEEREFEVFDSLSRTQAQKRDARQYQSGLVLRFHQRKGRFDKNELVQIVAAESNSLKVQRTDGSECIVPLSGPICFDVGEKRHLKVASGDKLLLQANWRKRFVNGELVEVAAVRGDSILLKDGRVIPGDYRTFTHGYAITSNAAQGKTADQVLVVASSRSLPAISQQQFYVSISRGRDFCRIFTDDKDRLRSHVTRSSSRLSAIEAVRMAPERRRGLLRRVLDWAVQLSKWNYMNKQSTQVVMLAPKDYAKTSRRISI